MATASPGVSQPMSCLKVSLGAHDSADTTTNQCDSPGVFLSRKRGSPRSPDDSFKKHRVDADIDSRPSLHGRSGRPILPTIATGADHADLNCISSETFRALVGGDFNDRIGRIIVFDCRRVGA